MAERYLGDRDGLLVGIALEAYHRRHGRYPATLGELTPDLLPAVPADRITGDPVRYRLVDGEPIVYSVGADRVDDGGRPADNGGPLAVDPLRVRTDAAASWGVSAADAPRGDWVCCTRRRTKSGDTHLGSGRSGSSAYLRRRLAGGNAGR